MVGVLIMSTPMKDPHDLESRRRALDGFPCFQLYLGWRRAKAYYRPWLDEGMPPQRMYVLGLLGEDAVGMTPLARALDLDLGTVSGLISRMEKQGLVARERSPENRLEVLVRATPTGQATYRRLETGLEDADRRLHESIAPRDHAGLQRIVATLDRLNAEEEPA